MKRFGILAMAIAACVLWGGPHARAADEWTNRQIMLEAAALTAIGVDWLQTRDIAEHPGKYSEKGCFGILGERPDKSNVDLYFATWAAIHLTVAHCLPSDYRELWQIGTTFAVVIATADNAAIGVRFEW
ncbi:hypothetical protein Dalk_0276 [Desulfatibacillum aliphaticivorans]|uniref:Uncharacterized protein n=1 Tax=Desulfatibacillum aliphaticivorans TaxID=218208 RepID=B8F8V3_DESAL|nr:hypothetical protein [Desulfatibacillum aliphaticivorans]ACL01985.1 hypothetical protein Dalk_0276 [Desulfatibacillum aliphaticivorans]